MAITDRKPTGLLRLALRAPIWLYRAGLGRVFGHRLVYLAHRGRRSGARREVVVEAVAYDPTTPSVTVVAAWGKNPDWYRNLLAAPAIELRDDSLRCWGFPKPRTIHSGRSWQTRCTRSSSPLSGESDVRHDPRQRRAPIRFCGR